MGLLFETVLITVVIGTSNISIIFQDAFHIQNDTFC